MKNALRMSLVLMLMLGVTTLASGAIFFGEDLNNSSSVPLATYPNASTAEANFLSNLVGVGTETFEGFLAGTNAPQTLTFPGAGTATLTGTGTIVSIPHGQTNGFGRYAISGTNYWEVSANTSVTPSFLINFSQPVAAFGFYGVDIGDFGGQIVLTLEGGSIISYTVNNTVGSGGSTDGSVLFWGIIDTSNPFTSIAFTDTNIGDVFAFDNMTIGSVEQVHPTPEPGMLLLLGAGFLGLVGLRRKVQK
jgi:hypothetical protein